MPPLLQSHSQWELPGPTSSLRLQDKATWGRPFLTNLRGFKEPTLGSDVPQSLEVGYSPGSRMQGVPSKKGLGYSSHLGETERWLNPRYPGTQAGGWEGRF